MVDIFISNEENSGVVHNSQSLQHPEDPGTPKKLEKKVCNPDQKGDPAAVLAA